MRSKEFYENLLKLKCQNILGYRVEKHTDLISLEVLLNDNTEEKISLSTLRRFFGFIPSTQPNNRTLNHISKALGYENFFHFCRLQNRSFEWSYYDLLIKIEKQEYINEEDYFYLKNNSSGTPHSFGYFIHQLINKGKFDLVNKLFQLPEIFPENIETKGEIADLMGLALRNSCPKSILNLIPYMDENGLLINYLLFYFVDYSSFKSWYINLLNQVTLNKKHNKLFRLLINNAWAIFSKKPLIPLPKVDTKNMHPILLGRYVGQQLFMGGSKKILLKYLGKRDVQSYFYEIFPMLIIMKDFSSIQLIEQRFYEELTTPSNNTFEDKKSMALLAFSILNLHQEKIKAAEINISFIQKNQIVNSYRDFILLMSYIPKYQITQINQDIAKQEEVIKAYLLLAKKLGFSFFDSNFLKKYFIPNTKTKAPILQ